MAAGCDVCRVARNATERARDALRASFPSWMEPSDGFNGFKQLTHFPSIRLAVANGTRFEPEIAYTCPTGYRWAGRKEVQKLMAASTHVSGKLISTRHGTVACCGSPLKIVWALQERSKQRTKATGNVGVSLEPKVRRHGRDNAAAFATTL